MNHWLNFSENDCFMHTEKCDAMRMCQIADICKTFRFPESIAYASLAHL